MLEVSVAEAKASLIKLLYRIEAGEQVTITRHGKPVARILSSKPFLRFESYADLRALQTSSIKTSSEHIHEMRDECI